jgi:phospholipid-binding lipoprotein MlaA
MTTATRLLARLGARVRAGGLVVRTSLGLGRSLPPRAVVGGRGDEPAGRSIGLRLAALALAGGLVGCASIPQGAGTNPVDPFEVYNRHMFEFNDRVDRALLKPIAQIYEASLPELVRNCVGNIFANLGELPTALNNLLQGKPADAAADVCRFALNSTVGLLGCFDVAAKAGLQRNNEDFGQTLGRWGLLPGPYFVLPLLGPSTIRDTLGRVVDMGVTDPVGYVDHVRTRNTLTGTRVVDTRASLLQAEKVLDAAALDKYQFVRDGYLQRRRNLVHDGNPPRLRDPEEEEDTPADKSGATPEKDQPAAQPPR